jgi:hypothetical protein
VKAALVVLIGAVGAIVSGIIVDRAGRNRSLGKFVAMASLCVATFVALVPPSAHRGSVLRCRRKPSLP